MRALYRFGERLDRAANISSSQPADWVHGDLQFTCYDRPLITGSRQLHQCESPDGTPSVEYREFEHTGALTAFDFETAYQSCYPFREYHGPRPTGFVSLDRRWWLTCADMLPHLDFLATGDALTPEQQALLARIGVHEPYEMREKVEKFWAPGVAKLVVRMQAGIDTLGRQYRLPRPRLNPADRLVDVLRDVSNWLLQVPVDGDRSDPFPSDAGVAPASLGLTPAADAKLTPFATTVTVEVGSGAPAPVATLSPTAPVVGQHEVREGEPKEKDTSLATGSPLSQTESDGPFKPFRFSYRRKPIYLGRAKLRYRLLISLWDAKNNRPHEPRLRAEVAALLWPRLKKTYGRFWDVREHLNSDLVRAQIPLKVMVSEDLVWLEVTCPPNLNPV